MTKSKRMESVKRVMHSRELKAAKLMGQSLQAVDVAKQQLKALRDYLKEYQQQFEDLSNTGVSVATLRDYQSFIGRLQAAIVEQLDVIKQKQSQQQQHHQQWKQKHIKTSVVGRVVARLKNSELQKEEALAQKVLDEANNRRFHMSKI